jgi:uncharacterized protein (DUF1778 family)
MPTQVISLRIDTELLEYLKERAEREHRTLTNMITSILLDAKEDSVKQSRTFNQTANEIHNIKHVETLTL